MPAETIARGGWEASFNQGAGASRCRSAMHHHVGPSVRVFPTSSGGFSRVDPGSSASSQPFRQPNSFQLPLAKDPFGSVDAPTALGILEAPAEQNLPTDLLPTEGCDV